MTKDDITKIADAVCERLEANSFGEMKEDIANLSERVDSMAEDLTKVVELTKEIPVINERLERLERLEDHGEGAPGHKVLGVPRTAAGSGPRDRVAHLTAACRVTSMEMRLGGLPRRSVEPAGSPGRIFLRRLSGVRGAVSLGHAAA